MKGKHHILLDTNRVRYEFTIRRNITVLQGDSATGKTTLVELLQQYARRGEGSGIRLEADVPVRVYAGDGEDWLTFLKNAKPCILFFDEDYPFIHSREFAREVAGSEHYFVLITRKPLTNLPYSIQEIYGIRTSGKYHFPEKVYNEFYPIFSNCVLREGQEHRILITEDAKAGFTFYQKAFPGVSCISSEGNANIAAVLSDLKEADACVVIADGAAFGAFVENVLSISTIMKKTALYFPESFEWLVLKSGILRDNEIQEVLEEPENFIESREYISWERFFTALLQRKTAGAKYMQYQKERLTDYYLSDSIVEKIISVIPDEITSLLLK